MAKRTTRKASGTTAAYAVPGAPGQASLHAAKALGAALIVLSLVIATHQRNGVWQSLLTLWQDCAAKSPLKSRTHNNLGNCYMLQGMPFDAIREYERAIELDPGNFEAYYNAAINLDDTGMFNRARYYYGAFCEAKLNAYADARARACRRFAELQAASIPDGKRRVGR